MSLDGDRQGPRGKALLLVVGFLIAVLSFGQPLAAYADSPTAAAKKADQTSSNDPSSTEPASPDPESASQSETPSPSQEKSAEPTTTPSSDKSTAEPTSSESSATPSQTATPKSPAVKKAAVVPQVVPPATGNNAVITVKVGGDRSGVSGVTGLAGVVLGFYANATGGTALFTCTSDADGDCSITVPNTQVGGANRDARYYVRQISAPTGWYQNPALGTGDTVASDNYVFRTGAQLQSGSTYTSTDDFMIGTGNTNNEASGGIWQNSRTNPVFPAKCGINVAILMDLSNSVGSDLPNLKTAAKTFVNALIGTPSSVATYTFATNAPANGSNNATHTLSPVSTSAGANTVNGHIDGLTLPGGNGGGTNWDRGLAQIATSAEKYDVVVVITDGNPTYYGNPVQGPGSRTRFREVENGIYSSNAIKANNSRVIAFGVGSGVGSTASGLNLKSISGPTLNSDYYQTTDYAAAGDALKALAQGKCIGSISVVKQVVPSTTPTGSTAGATPAGGWDFTGAGTAGVVTVDAPTTRTTAGGTGGANFPLTFVGANTSGEVTLTETLQSGYTLHQGVTGQNAVCTRLDTGANIVPTNVGSTGFSVSANLDYAVSCNVYNRAPSPQATVTLNKTWVVNGVTFDQGSQPDGLIAAGLLNGDAVPWGQEQTGFQQNQSVTIDETTRIVGRPLCSLTSSRLTSANGTTVDLPLAATQTLTQAANTYMITNTVTCDTKLKLTKTVEGGVNQPAASDWTLTANTPNGALTGPSGPTGVNGSVTPNVTYSLAEDDPHPEYLQFVDPTATLIPGSTGSWNCQEVEPDGETVIPGFQDGLNGGVTVPVGNYVRCNAVNQTATLGLVKEVNNDNGGTAVPSDWQLHATPTGDFPAGLPTITQTGTDADHVVYVNVRPNVEYNLTESDGPAGYRLVSTQCSIEQHLREPAVGVILQPGFIGTCYFTNQDLPARLTLIKHVDNGTTGGTLEPADFVLTAAGPNATVTGPGNSDQVTDQRVPAGDYALSEVGNVGYTASGWTCTGGTLTGTTVAVPLGGDVTCEITNTAQQAHLTLIKTVTNDNGGSAVPTDWTLSATGGPTGGISGPTGGGAVTDVAVDPGTYTLGESGPGGYAAGAWSCTGGGTATTPVQVRLGDDVTCTINNDDTAAHLTLVKVVDNGTTGATHVPGDWTLSADGPTPITGPGDSAAVTNQPVSAGTYTLSESGGPDGYTAGSWSCSGADATGSSVVVPNGGDVTCTITNTAQQAHLTLVKVVDNGDTGGIAVPADWTLSAANGGTVITGPGNSPEVTRQVVPVGDYALSEAGGPDGYTPSDWSCSGADESSATGVTIEPGDDVTCTITNTAIAPTLTLIKVVDNGTTGGSAVATDWTLAAVNGASMISGITGTADVTDAAAVVGTYDLSETGPAGYAGSDWVCTGGSSTTAGSVTLALDDHATCTITNTAQQAQLTLVKTVTNNNGGTAAPTDWTLSATGPTPDVIGRVGEDSVTNVPVQPGTYLLGEGDGPAGYTPGDWSCTGGSLDGSVVSIALGDDVTCTIDNDDQPAHLTLVKTVENGNTGATTPATVWTLSADGATPISGATGSADVTKAVVDAGSYDLTESGPAGYDQSAWDCGDAVTSGATVTVPNGGDVTCTITNTAEQPHLTLIKTVTNDNGGTAVPTDWTLAAAGPTSGITGAVGDAAVTDVPVQVGGYDLSESGGPSEYTPSGWTCDAGSLSGSTVTIGLGEDVTCTIDNNDVPPVWRLAKTSDPVSGSTVNPDDTITYTVTATKISGVDPTDLTVVDDLSDVLNNAKLISGPTASTGTAVVSGSTMTWLIPTLSDTATVTYTVRVNPDAYGVELANVVTGTGSETCTAPDGDRAARLVATRAVTTRAVTSAADDEQCDTHHYTPVWTLAKGSNPAPGSTVQPGSTITYTLTATNTSEHATLSGAVATDDLSDVLAHGTLVAVPAGATLNGTTLTWHVPDLDPGESATLTYQVRLDDDAWDVSVTNVATPGNGGTCPSSCTTDHHTPNKPHEPNLPNTGGPALATIGIGLALLVSGGGLLLRARRRRAG